MNVFKLESWLYNPDPLEVVLGDSVRNVLWYCIVVIAG